MDELYTRHHIPRLETLVPHVLEYNDHTPAEALQLRALCKIADMLTRIEHKMKD